jgi:N-methylhydantoinase A
MMRAIKAVSSERGRDPREYTLFAVGGNGPVFAAGMARALEMRRILIPPAPGLFSSFGLLYSDVEHHSVRTWRRPVRQVDAAELNQVWGRMEAEVLAQLKAEGFTGAAARVRRSADCRYQGQSFELTIPLGAGPLDAAGLAALEEAFGREHARVYGHRAGPEEPVEIVNLRVVGQGIPAEPRVPAGVRLDRGAAVDPATRRRVYFGPEEGWRETPILGRGDLAAPRVGPCIVEEYDATCVVPPGVKAALDGHGNIALEVPPEGEEV